MVRSMATTMTGMRVPYAMTERKLLPFSHLFIKLTKSGAPWFGAIIQLIIAIIMMSMGAFDTITNMLILLFGSSIVCHLLR